MVVGRACGQLVAAGCRVCPAELVGRGGVLPELCLPGVELDAADRPVRVAGGGGQRDRRPLRKARPVGRLAQADRRRAVTRRWWVGAALPELDAGEVGVGAGGEVEGAVGDRGGPGAESFPAAAAAGLVAAADEAAFEADVEAGVVVVFPDGEVDLVCAAGDLRRSGSWSGSSPRPRSGSSARGRVGGRVEHAGLVFEADRPGRHVRGRARLPGLPVDRQRRPTQIDRAVEAPGRRRGGGGFVPSAERMPASQLSARLL